MENDLRDKELDGLFAAARKAGPDGFNAEHGFESRVMARIRAEREGAAGPLFLWAWRLIPVFFSIVILLGFWLYESEPRYMTDLSAITGIGNEETTLTAFLTGE